MLINWLSSFRKEDKRIPLLDKAIDLESENLKKSLTIEEVEALPPGKFVERLHRIRQQQQLEDDEKTKLVVSLEAFNCILGRDQLLPIHSIGLQLEGLIWLIHSMI